jgi:hypothetical protein
MSFLWPLLGLLIGCSAVGVAIWLSMRLRTRNLVRERRIRDHVFSGPLLQALRVEYPHLQPHDLARVGQALRGFFLAHLHSGRKTLAMPSRAADALWHHFTQDEQAYARFCREAFGHVLHRMPARAAPAGVARSSRHADWRETWRLVCREENIDPVHPARLPLLFALDAELAIPEGLHHRLDDLRTAARRDTGGEADDFSALAVLASWGSSHPPHDSDSSDSSDGSDGGSGGD